jgi:hypothetical protein
VQRLDDLLAVRYAPPEWIFLPELANRTGYAETPGARALHVADAVAFSPWPSRGLAVHGFEIKVARSDWLRERRNPEKGEGFGKYCQYWWLVVAERQLVKRAELPDTWGLLVPKGTKLRVVVPARRRKARPMDALMAAALLRCVASRWLPPQQQHRQLAAAFDRGKRLGDAGELDAEVQRLEHRLRLATSGCITGLRGALPRLRDLVDDVAHMERRLTAMRFDASGGK